MDGWIDECQGYCGCKNVRVWLYFYHYIRKCGCVFVSQYENIDKNTPINYKLA